VRLDEWSSAQLRQNAASTDEVVAMTRVGILTNTKETYEFGRIVEELKMRGYEPVFMQPHRLAAKMGKTSSLLYDGQPFESPAVVLVRSTGAAGPHAASIVRAMQSAGTVVINRLEAIEKARDKAYTLQLAAADGLPIPETLIHAPTEAIVKAWKGGYCIPCFRTPCLGRSLAPSGVAVIGGE
jgi:glutathione synthase/RimK-type ligase-like ATP-grasp enzyme